MYDDEFKYFEDIPEEEKIEKASEEELQGYLNGFSFDNQESAEQYDEVTEDDMYVAKKFLFWRHPTKPLAVGVILGVIALFFAIAAHVSGSAEKIQTADMILLSVCPFYIFVLYQVQAFALYRWQREFKQICLRTGYLDSEILNMYIRAESRSRLYADIAEDFVNGVEAKVVRQNVKEYLKSTPALLR